MGSILLKRKDPYGKVKKIAFKDFHRQECYALNNSDSEVYTRQDFYETLTSKIFGHSNLSQPTLPEQQHAAPPFHMQKLKSAIFSFNINKAPGLDNIDHIISRNLFKKQAPLLLSMYNAALDLNYFPLDWKRRELVYFLKPNKKPEKPDSYRPILLLPVFGKVYEKLLLKIINYSLKDSIKL